MLFCRHLKCNSLNIYRIEKCFNFILPELFNVNAMVAFAKENVETLMSVLDSVWSIFKGNMSLAFYSFTALIGILFGGGTAVLNFILNMVC